jgi:ABC-type multidrug transport system permease subunit
MCCATVKKLRFRKGAARVPARSVRFFTYGSGWVMVVIAAGAVALVVFLVLASFFSS